jgi:5'-nucleotidase
LDACLPLDAGDIFQGTPYFGYGGRARILKLMSMMKYDLSTIGNHDFDNGIEGLYAQMPHAKFEYITIMILKYRNGWHSKTLQGFLIKKGIKIGVFDIGIQLDGLVDSVQKKQCK